MSHLVKIELEINDVNVLQKSCDRLGLSFMKNQNTFQWWGQAAKCDHAIKIPEAKYEIGVLKKQQGGYELQCDYFDRAVGKAIGQNGGLLKQAYTIEKAKQEAIRKGYSIREHKTQQGIQLRIEVR